MGGVTTSSAGNSIKIPNVQALAEELSDVPPRYIRPETEVETISRVGDLELPVVDLERLLDPRSRDEESAKLKYACEDWGFFRLINHGVPAGAMERMGKDLEEFFDLPLEKKQAFAQEAGDLQGYGQAFVVSDDQKLDWADMLYIVTRPTASRKARVWPTQPSTFSETLDKYSFELSKVSRCLMGFIANNLGLEPEVLLKFFKGQGQSMRMNYYPPCPKADKVLGLTPHTDAVGLTILLQTGDVDGLQIRKNGDWFPVPHLPGSFVVNIGDILEILSNGKYKSIEHRAVVDTKRERISIATFHGPDMNTAVGPIPELVRNDREHFKTKSYENYMKSYFSEELGGRRLLESMMLK